MSVRDLIQRSRFPLSIRQGGADSSLAALQDEMNRVFDHFFSGAQARLTDWAGRAPAAPAVDVSENAKEFVIKAEMGGMAPEDIEIEVTDGYITLRGEKKSESKEEQENYLCREIAYGSFFRTIALPETAECRSAEASFKGGMMTVIVPKKEAAIAKPQKLKIKSAA
ncbi:MAG: Hsp20/alpha crystallin family protein [Pseudobdellovibrionaceae bacterium]